MFYLLFVIKFSFPDGFTNPMPHTQNLTDSSWLSGSRHVGFLDFLGTIAEGIGDMHWDGHDDDHFGC